MYTFYRPSPQKPTNYNVVKTYDFTAKLQVFLTKFCDTCAFVTTSLRLDILLVHVSHHLQLHINKCKALHKRFTLSGQSCKTSLVELRYLSCFCYGKDHLTFEGGVEDLRKKNLQNLYSKKNHVTRMAMTNMHGLP